VRRRGRGSGRPRRGGGSKGELNDQIWGILSRRWGWGCEGGAPREEKERVAAEGGGGGEGDGVVGSDEGADGLGGLEGGGAEGGGVFLRVGDGLADENGVEEARAAVA
jgi:hypothetical protein